MKKLRTIYDEEYTLSDWWRELCYRLRRVRYLFWMRCEDPHCGRIDGLLWWAIGDHKDCLPF